MVARKPAWLEQESNDNPGTSPCHIDLNRATCHKFGVLMQLRWWLMHDCSARCACKHLSAPQLRSSAGNMQRQSIPNLMFMHVFLIFKNKIIRFRGENNHVAEVFLKLPQVLYRFWWPPGMFCIKILPRICYICACLLNWTLYLKFIMNKQNP